MRKRRQLRRMLVGKAARVCAAKESWGDLDAEYGLDFLALSDTIGGMEPLALEIGGAPIGDRAPSLDAPLPAWSTGEHQIDRIGRGFFRVNGGDIETLLFDTEGLSTDRPVTVSIDLGSDYHGTVTVELGEEIVTRTLSGSVGKRLSFSVSGAAAALGSLDFMPSEDGLFRLSLHGEGEAGEGLALSVLLTEDNSDQYSYSRILLPAPLYFLPSGQSNTLSLSDRRMRLRVALAELSSKNAPVWIPETADASAPAFRLTAFPEGRGACEASSGHGPVGIDDEAVLSGTGEGLSLLSDDPTSLAVSLGYRRLTDGCTAVFPRRLDDGTEGTLDAPVIPSFYPYGGVEHYLLTDDGTVLSLRLSEPLRSVGTYRDQLLIDLKARVALRVTRIGQLTLTGRESFTMQTKLLASVFNMYYRGGQMTNVSNSVPQLSSHGRISAEIALIYPERTEDLTSYLDVAHLTIAISRDRAVAASLSRFRDYLASCAEVGRPYTHLFPLAEPRFEVIPLTVTTYPEIPEDDPLWLVPETVTARDRDTLEGLFRLWLDRQSPSLWATYLMPSSLSLPLGDVTGVLRMPELAPCRLTTLGEGKPYSVSLEALVYPSGAATLADGAAGQGEK